MLSKLKDLDFYRSIPKDLTESTSHGVVISVIASFFMLCLFIAELWSFLSVQVSTDIILDPSRDVQLMINFNITVLDMPCEYAVIDVVDALGTRKDNVTYQIHKWQVDESGIRKNYEGHNVKQRELAHDTHHDLKLLQANGIHAVPMQQDSFAAWLDNNEYTFVNFYAPWCSWCQRLEPVWEAFAEKMSIDQIPVSVVKVDCVANRELCVQQRIQAFPQLRLFKNGKVQPPDYRSDRTVEALTEFVSARLSKDEQLSLLPPVEQEAHLARAVEERDDHPGCLLSGVLHVNRVPGNFHIVMRSKHHNINPTMANLSHVVNSLSFGPPISKYFQRKLEMVPEAFFSIENTRPIDGEFYMNHKLHQAYHHYLKVVSTSLELGSGRRKGPAAAYQVVPSNQIMTYEEGDIPEARFTYDISPMAVVIKRSGKHWYDFATSMCALIGGTFTFLGLFNGFLGMMFKAKKI